MPRTAHSPYFYFYPDDFSSDRNVEAMTTEEVGAFTLLICKSWREEPVASIPDDDRILARWARLTPDQWSACRSAVLAAFKLGKDGRWHQKRLRLEYDKLRRITKNRSEAGHKGAMARHGKPCPDNELDSSAMAAPQQTQDFANPNACHTVLTNRVVVSSSEVSSVQKKNGVSPKPHAHGRGVADELWGKFYAKCLERSILQGSEDDWREAYYAWGPLPIEERLKAFNDVSVRASDSVELRPPSLPQNYLAKRKWGRGKATQAPENKTEKSVAMYLRAKGAHK